MPCYSFGDLWMCALSSAPVKTPVQHHYSSNSLIMPEPKSVQCQRGNELTLALLVPHNANGNLGVLNIRARSCSKFGSHALPDSAVNLPMASIQG